MLSLPTDPSTNRLTSFPYDNSGAMTAWTPGNVYHREDLGLIWRHEGGTWTVERDYVYREGVPLAAVLPTGHEVHRPRAGPGGGVERGG